MIKEFKEFMMRGNVVDMAVGLVIGTAFTAVITAFVKSVITPLITLIVVLLTGSKDTQFSTLNISAHGVVFEFGTLVSAVITFILTGFVLFLFVKAINKLRAMNSTDEEDDTVIRTELDYLEEIRDLLAGKNDKD